MHGGKSYELLIKFQIIFIHWRVCKACPVFCIFIIDSLYGIQTLCICYLSYCKFWYLFHFFFGKHTYFIFIWYVFLDFNFSIICYFVEYFFFSFVQNMWKTCKPYLFWKIISQLLNPIVCDLQINWLWFVSCQKMLIFPISVSVFSIFTLSLTTSSSFFSH